MHKLLIALLIISHTLLHSSEDLPTMRPVTGFEALIVFTRLDDADSLTKALDIAHQKHGLAGALRKTTDSQDKLTLRDIAEKSQSDRCLQVLKHFQAISNQYNCTVQSLHEAIKKDDRTALESALSTAKSSGMDLGWILHHRIKDHSSFSLALAYNDPPLNKVLQAYLH